MIATPITDMQAGAAVPELSLAYCGGAKNLPALLLIHGWGSTSDIWAQLRGDLEKRFSVYALDLPGHGANADVACESPEAFYQAYFSTLEPQLPKQYTLLGWSLGGSLAAGIALRSKAVVALFTVASNPVFLERDDWSCAMQADVLTSFSDALLANSKKTRQRFYALQAQGGSEARRALRFMQGLGSEGQFNVSQLLRMLNWLAAQDMRECYRGLSMPVTHYFGAGDTIVPVALSKHIAYEFPTHKLRVLPNSAHLPFFSERDRWLQQFLSDAAGELEKKELDKNAVAKAFSKAAPNYERYAQLQSVVGERLCALMEDEIALHRDAWQRSDARLIDLGSGTGLFANKLKQLLPVCSQVLELDLSMGMLQHSRAQHRSDQTGSVHVQADFDALPFTENSCDAIYANFSLQWCEDFEQSLKHFSRLLRPGGSIFFSTLAAGSLHEISAAWSSVDAELHVNHFASTQDLHRAAKASGLQQVVCDARDELLHFDTADDLLRSVKGIGAGNHLRSRPRGLTGVKRYREFLRALELSRDEQGRLPLTYRVVTMHLRRDCD